MNLELKRSQVPDHLLRFFKPIDHKPKDLIDTPHLVVEALRRDGWYLRSEIIWHKPNSMPEAVTDRPTLNHECVFLLSKSARYFYDQEAVRESQSKTTFAHSPIHGANLRSVWSIPTQSTHAAHFASFPNALVERCVKAGTSEKGVCPECRAPWRRVVERGSIEKVSAGPNKEATHTDHFLDGADAGGRGYKFQRDGFMQGHAYARSTTGWEPTCPHKDLRPVPATVLDPFIGSGTTAAVAAGLGCKSIGCDAAAYLNMAIVRLRSPRGRI